MSRGFPIYFHEADKVFLPVYKCGYKSSHQAYSKLGIVLHSFNDLIDYDCEKVTLVRNPFDRIVSLYTCGNNNISGLNSVPRSFEDYLDEVDRLLKSGETNGHYNTLTANLSIKGFFQPDTIFKLEELDKLVNYLPKTDFPKVNASPHRDHYRDYYDDRSIRIVERIYAEDLERFGYEF